MSKKDFKKSKVKNKKLKFNFSIDKKKLRVFARILFSCIFWALLLWYFIYIWEQVKQKIIPEYYQFKNSSIDLNLTGHSFQAIKMPKFSKPIYMVAWWDVMLSRNIWYFAKNEWYDRIFKEWNYNPLSEFLNCTKEDCLLFLNLESLFCEPDHDIQMWWFDFRSNPQNIETLEQYRWNIPLLLALPNNHFINWWFQWLTITKDLLSWHGIFSVGAWFTEEESREVFSREENNMKICLWAYSYDWWIANVRWWKVVRNDLKESKIKEDLEKMESELCDVKIISLHRWTEYRFSPNWKQRNLAHALIDSGADLILWGHSHIPGEFEKYNWKYIFYSLWNFIFDQWWGKRATERDFDYFYDADLERKTVPTYISMMIGLSFTKNIMEEVDINLEQIEFASTTDWLFSKIWSGTRQNLLDIINVSGEIF